MMNYKKKKEGKRVMKVEEKKRLGNELVLFVPFVKIFSAIVRNASPLFLTKSFSWH